MKDLSQLSGLEIKLDEEKLVYDKQVFPFEPKTRTMDDARDVYLKKGEPQKDLYYMYRFFEKPNDIKTFENIKAEYDITVFNPGTVGEEFIKTVGHYHGLVPGTNITYPEVYEVLDGQIEFLLQSLPNEEGTVDVVIVQAEVGDKVVSPPNYGHIMVNIGSEPAISSNIQFRNGTAGASYEFYPAHQGGALYRTQAEEWVKNPNYKIGTTKTIKPKEKPEWGLVKNKPLYDSFIEEPEKFRWISEPQNYDFSEFLK